jgi:hypothetical protein
MRQEEARRQQAVQAAAQPAPVEVAQRQLS